MKGEKEIYLFDWSNYNCYNIHVPSQLDSPVRKAGRKGASFMVDFNSSMKEGKKEGEEDNGNDRLSLSGQTPSQSAETTLIRQQFGRILRQIRKVRGKSISTLAKEAGVDGGYISRLENAHRNPPSPKILERFANALKVKVDLLMMAAGHLKYDTLTGDLLDEERIMIKVERALQGIEERAKSQNLETSVSEEETILPILKSGDRVLAVTEEGKLVCGEVYFRIATGKVIVENIVEIKGKIGS